jgi:transcriptional regulator with XRE-family HTH domain
MMARKFSGIILLDVTHKRPRGSAWARGLIACQSLTFGLTKVRMAGVGAKLRAIRQQWQLSLREVEQRSRRIAEEWSDPSYQVSSSWLSRLERGEHELTVNKLIALGEIYRISTDRLIRSIYPENGQPLITDQISGRNTTMLLAGGSPDQTTLLPAPTRTPYRRGIIGKLGVTLHPMIQAGSIVRIDTEKREVSPKKNWTHEFQRPIYFLKTKDAYFCGWCELDEDSQWLTLIPHPLSSASSRRWRYGTEVENLGRVVSNAIPIALKSMGNSLLIN